MEILVTELKPGDIFEMEYGDYGNWITARCIAVNLLPDNYLDVEIVFEYAQNGSAPHHGYTNHYNTVKLKRERGSNE